MQVTAQQNRCASPSARFHQRWIALRYLLSKNASHAARLNKKRHDRDDQVLTVESPKVSSPCASIRMQLRTFYNTRLHIFKDINETCNIANGNSLQSSSGCYCDQRNYNPPPYLADFQISKDPSYQDISRFLSNLLRGVLVRVFGCLLLNLLRVFFSVTLSINSQTLDASLDFINETLKIL